ncbi:MAG: hypothetical protein HC786_15260 [Richelia sp. CSU_2_1]|nr:hypothetical protein [Richelia sp. CSU_2_1]
MFLYKGRAASANFPTTATISIIVWSWVALDRSIAVVVWERSPGGYTCLLHRCIALA